MASKEALEDLHRSLAKGLLPKSQDIHSHIQGFLGDEVKDFERFNQQNDKLLDKLKDEYEQYNRTISELKNKLRKDHKFVEGSFNYLKAKEDEITGKKKTLESISTGLKESVSKIDPEKLAELPYEKEPILRQLFVKLFIVLYNEPEGKYDWNTFKMKALLHYKGQDFLTRLANINFRDMPEMSYNLFLQLKNDEQFKDACENSAYAIHIVDMADWIDYVCEGQKMSKDKKNIEQEYHKILVDKEKRAGKNTQLKEDFCTEAMQDIDSYQNNLMWLESEFRTIIIGMNSSIEDITELDASRNQAITKVNSL